MIRLPDGVSVRDYMTSLLWGLGLRNLGPDTIDAAFAAAALGKEHFDRWVDARRRHEAIINSPAGSAIMAVLTNAYDPQDPKTIRTATAPPADPVMAEFIAAISDELRARFTLIDKFNDEVGLL